MMKMAESGIDAGSGLVLETDGGHARVRVVSESGACGSGSCASCAGGCHGGLFGETSGRVIQVTNAIGAGVGDLVLLESRPGVRFSAVTLLFVVPLVFFLAGFVLGTEIVPGSDSLAVLLAFGLAGLWYVGLALVHQKKTGRTPVWIAKVIAPGRGDDRGIQDV